MSPVQELHEPPAAAAPETAEVEITAAAVDSYRRLLRAVGHRVHTHGTHDGGLICEDRTATFARPTMWRIHGDGTVAADAPYNFLLGAFVPARLPVAPRPAAV